MTSEPTRIPNPAISRAVEIFAFELRSAHSPLIECVWRTKSVPLDAFISVAMPQWQIVVTRQFGRAKLTLRGPETKATPVAIPGDAEFIGIQLRLGTFIPGLLAELLVDGELRLPDASPGSFRLRGSAWDVPSYDNAETFVARLAREGLLSSDPFVLPALAGEPVSLSRRTIERRIRRATGLTPGLIRRMDRAARAAELLDCGAPILDVVARAGYADQPHLTRSLRRFTGQTPAEIARHAAVRIAAGVQDIGAGRKHGFAWQPGRIASLRP